MCDAFPPIMRVTSLVLVATLVMTICVGTAAAGPPGTAPATKKSNAPRTATIVSGIALLVGAVVVYDGAFPSCLDDCPTDETQMAVGGAILLVAPTLVRLPAREIGAVHLGIRLAGAAIITGAAISRDSDDAPYLIGAGLVFAGAISDMVTVHGAYRRWNERHAISVVPATITPSGISPGLSFSGRF
jgi:hypothetical protein